MNRSLARSISYDILSRFYTYPDEEFCSWITAGAWLEPLREALRCLIEDGFTGYLQYCEELISKKEEAFLEMRRGYQRLFINALPHAGAPPYGSSYMGQKTDHGGAMCGKISSEILCFYHEHGFTVKEGENHPDHITQELQFMGLLADRAALVAGNEKIKLEEVQMHFFSRFVLPWVPVFCERIAKQASFPFYRCLGDLTRDFIYFEKNYLGVPEGDFPDDAIGKVQ